MYEVYILKFKTSQKIYVGYTSIGVMNRFRKHCTNAYSGLESKLYRAIRKYGEKDIAIKIASSHNLKDEAKRKEIELIEKYDSFKSGYNMTHGGDGGWCVQDKESWRKKLSASNKGLGNSNSIKISNDGILEAAVQFYLNNNHKLTRNAWTKFSKENGLPQNYTKYRFGGGYKNFLKALKSELSKRGIAWKEENFHLSYQERYTEEFSKKISNTLKAKHVKNKKDQKR
jgi:hypothetical protein